MNGISETVHFYLVTREFTGISPAIGDGYWVTTSVPATPPAGSISEIQAGIQEAKTLFSQVAQVDIGDLDLGPVEIGSAPDLLDPGDLLSPPQPSPGVIALRGTVQNSLKNYFSQPGRQLIIDLSELFGRAIDKFLPISCINFRVREPGE